jgi:hypothetical protein
MLENVLLLQSIMQDSVRCRSRRTSYGPVYGVREGLGDDQSFPSTHSARRITFAADHRMKFKRDLPTYAHHVAFPPGCITFR